MPWLLLLLVACLLFAAAPASAQEEGGGAFTITEQPHAATTYLAYRDTVAMDAMQAFYGTHLPAAYGVLAGAGLTPGTPTGIYWSWDEATRTTDMAAAVPFDGDAPADVPPGYTVITLPAGTAVGVDYVGPYEGLGSAHEALGAHLAASGQEGVVAVEAYVTDPMSEPDPSKWLTKVYYVVPE